MMTTETEAQDLEALIQGPYSLNADGSIECTFVHPVDGPIPFTASETDTEAHGRLIHAYATEQMGREPV